MNKILVSLFALSISSVSAYAATPQTTTNALRASNSAPTCLRAQMAKKYDKAYQNVQLYAQKLSDAKHEVHALADVVKANPTPQNKKALSIAFKNSRRAEAVYRTNDGFAMQLHNAYEAIDPRPYGESVTHDLNARTKEYVEIVAKGEK